MRLSRMAWPCLLVAVVAGAMLAVPAGALAAPPEFGRCVKVANVGAYRNAACTSRQLSNKGPYEWMPGPGEKSGFSGVGEGTTLETVGGVRISCAQTQFNGKYATAKTETVTVSLIGCIEVATKANCQSSPVPASEGEIISSEAVGELGFIRGGSLPLIGLDLKAKEGGALFSFECGTVPTVVLTDTVEGSVIGTIKPNSKMSEVFKGVFKQAHGVQAVKHFDGGPNDTLTSKVVSSKGAATEETGFGSTREDTNEEPMEVKAK